MRLIDADALEDYIKSDESGLCDAREFQRDYIECIDHMPTVDPVKHGHWIITEDAYGRKYGVCSECGNKDNVTTAVLDHYCWFCGTKMDEPQQT